MRVFRQQSYFSATNDKVEGTMRKTVQQKKYFQKTCFPLRFFVCDKIKRKLSIFDKPNGALKQEIKIEQIVKVEVIDPYNVLKGKRINPGSDDPYSVVPNDFPCAFTIYLTNRVMLLWAYDELERQHWVRCLREMITGFQQQQEFAGNKIKLSVQSD